MKEIKINTYNELIEQIENISSQKIYKLDGQLKRFFYRGHASKNWNLEPTILRNQDAQENEELREIFNKVKNEKSKIALAVAQHYGRKTRCLDFTRNYKIALYFACNPNDSAYNEDGAIFIIEKSYHRPEWFTNYLVYYAAIDPRDYVSSWDFSDYIIQKDEICKEFARTGRSFEKGDVNNEVQIYLSKGFMVDFENNDYGFERIDKQEAALYYFGSKYYLEENGKNYYADPAHISKWWSSQNMFIIELHNLSNSNLENDPYCTKIIIPHRLKKEIFEKINIKASDLGL